MVHIAVAHGNKLKKNGQNDSRCGASLKTTLVSLLSDLTPMYILHYFAHLKSFNDFLALERVRMYKKIILLILLFALIILYEKSKTT